ncbi:MAG TPA: hypothetical protein VFK72_11095 [Nevskia sp.]|nr:hypothetical protein [Nevskia sp.]
MSLRRTSALSLLACAGLLLAITPVHAQNLLKPGQGLAGAPEAAKPVEPADGKTAPVTVLPEVQVEGDPDPLTKSDRKRRAQAKRLPGLNSDDERKLDQAEQLQQWYDSLEKDPNNLDADNQQFLDQTVNSTDLNRRPGAPSTLPRRDPADYRDPIATP